MRALAEHIPFPHFSLLQLGIEVVSLARIQRGPPISPTHPADTKASAFPVAARWASTTLYCILTTSNLFPSFATDLMGGYSICAHWPSTF